MVFRFQLWHLGEGFGNVYLHLVEFCVIMVKRKGAGEIQVLMCKTQDTQNEGIIDSLLRFGTSTVLRVFKCHMRTCLLPAHLSVAEIIASAGCLCSLQTNNIVSSCQAAFYKQS